MRRVRARLPRADDPGSLGGVRTRLITTANSETNTSYEAGVKTAFWDDRIHFNAAGFYYNVDNIQLNGNDSNGNGVLFNANKGKGYGTEAELDARPVPNLHSTPGSACCTPRSTSATSTRRSAR